MSDPIRRQVGLSIKRVQARNHRTVDSRLAPIGLSLVQWDALRHLSENPDASLHDLAQLTFQSDQAFGSLASRMIDRGLIERLSGPGRAIRHRISATGVALLDQANAIVDDALAELLGPLTPRQLQTLGDLLGKLILGRS